MLPEKRNMIQGHLILKKNIKDAIQEIVDGIGYRSAEIIPENKVLCDKIWLPKYYYSNKKEESYMLNRHGYILGSYRLSDDSYTYIKFQKGSHCVSDKRMMSADEMYTFFEQLLAQRKSRYEQYMLDTAYQIFKSPSFSTIENNDYILKEYAFSDASCIPYILKVVEEIKEKLPNVQGEISNTKCTIVLSIPKEYSM